MQTNTPSSPPAFPVTRPSPTGFEGKMKFWSRAIWASVVMIIAPPMLGLIGTVIGMQKAFASMGNSGIGDPQALSGHISMVLLSTVWGLVFSVIGLVLLSISVIRFFSCRARHQSSVP
jgi:biopolymer transport protein ExbB/TolQ